MNRKNVDYYKLEETIDSWIPNILNKNISRYSFIFHCNCAYVDAVVEMGCLFSSAEFPERHLMFALSYLTHLAYKYLDEEDVFMYKIDDSIYNYTYNLLIESYKYAELCDIFPKIHNNKASIYNECDTNVIYENELYRERSQQYEYYLLRKPLHYILQYGCGKTVHMPINQRQSILFELFNDYWNENLHSDDYEPYTSIEGNGIRSFLISAAIKRYIQLYDADYKVRSLRLTQLLICFSQDAISKIRKIIPTDNDRFYLQAIEDCIYKPLGDTDYPKANLADAPIIKTKDGCMFVNPFLLLFNNSIDTQFLNYLRRNDKTRFLRIKDKIKERCIPEVESWLSSNINNLNKISNFEINIPGTKNKRELDLLISDDEGNALYLEFKHFYIPESYSEKRNLDKELCKAQTKMNDQLYAIEQNRETIKELFELTFEVKNIKGIIVSYFYTGTDVNISDNCPIVSLLTIKQAIAESKSVNDIFRFCQTSENKHVDIPFVKQDFSFNYANINFKTTKMVFNPLFEKKANKYLYDSVSSSIDAGNTLKSVKYKELKICEILNT